MSLPRLGIVKAHLGPVFSVITVTHLAALIFAATIFIRVAVAEVVNKLCLMNRRIIKMLFKHATNCDFRL